MGAVLFPVFARARENARKSSCQNNLKQIALAVKQFEVDHNDTYPKSATAEGWKNELNPYLSIGRVWTCPGHEEEGSGYEINPRVAGVSSGQIPNSAGLPIAWDKQPHHLDGRNVAFADGHIKWFAEEAFQSSVKPEAENFTPSAGP
jgi:prepilin-type processing-associated H-X9-DG protein